MGNELREWLAEREAYEKEVYADFIEQSKEYPESGISVSEYIEYLIGRMYHGGLSAKE